MKIEIVGPGCPRCITTEKNVKEAVKGLGIEAEICHVYDFSEIARMGVMFTPAVVIDGKIKVSGKIPTVDEIKKILSANK